MTIESRRIEILEDLVEVHYRFFDNSKRLSRKGWEWQPVKQSTRSPADIYGAKPVDLPMYGRILK